MKDKMVSKGFWYLTFFQFFYIAILIWLSYVALENKTVLSVIRFIQELITIPVILSVFFCVIYFGWKLFRMKYSKQILLIFAINLLTVGVMIIFTFIQM